MAARRTGGARRKPAPEMTESEEQAQALGAQLDRGIAEQQRLEDARARRGRDGSEDFEPARIDPEDALDLERKALKEEWGELAALVGVVQKGLHDSRVLEAAAGALETIASVHRRLLTIARICGGGAEE